MMRMILLAAMASLGGCGGPAAPLPCQSTPLTKGPWSMRATESGASVFWETRDLPSCVAIGVTPESGGAETIAKGVATMTTVQTAYPSDRAKVPGDDAGTFYVNRVDLGSLPAGACYSYRVRATAPSDVTDGNGEARGRFCTAKPAGQPFKFFAIGDTNPILQHTQGTLDHTLSEKPDFLIHMGDMHYYSSTETWQYWFTHMKSMLAAGPFFPAVGNHDGFATFDTPTDYADYTDRLFHAPSLDGTAGEKSSWYRFEWGGVWFHTVDTEAPYDSASPQYKWLEQSLEEVTHKPGFRFSVVYMHRNLYTLGDSEPLVDVRKSLAPIFESNKVRLVVSGHMHGYERFEVSDITYVTTGGGGGTLGDVNMNLPNYPADVPLRVVGLLVYHAMLFDVTPMGSATEVHGRAIGEDGKVLDEFTHLIP